MDSKEKARVENRCAFLKTEIKKYKDHIAFTERFLEDAENELDSLVNELVEAEEQAKAEAAQQKKEEKVSSFDNLFADLAKGKFGDCVAQISEGKPLKKRMEFGVIQDGNGGVVYTYGQNTPLIDKVVKELCDRLPNDIF